jgi:hypothetical protein
MLDCILNDSERAEIDQLVRETNNQGAQAFTWWSPEKKLVLIGVASQGELLTWFASPAQTQVEAMSIQAVVTCGMRVAASVVINANQQAVDEANALISRVRH